MTVSLPSWAGRVGAVAVLLLLLALIYALVVAPIAGAYDQTRRELIRAERTLARYEAFAAGSGELERLTSQLEARQASSGVFLSGATESIAAAGLQDRVGAAVERAGGEVRSVQSLSVSEEDGLKRIGVRVQFLGSVRALKALLYELEAGRPLLFVDEFNVRGRLERAAGEGGDLDVSQDLLVELSVSGYRLGGQA